MAHFCVYRMFAYIYLHWIQEGLDPSQDVSDQQDVGVCMQACDGVVKCPRAAHTEPSLWLFGGLANSFGVAMRLAP